MGSGSHFQAYILQGWGLGVYLDKFPHKHSLTINIIKFGIYIGFGKGYDE